MAHLTGQNEMKSCFDSVASTSAKVLHLDKWSQKGCNAGLSYAGHNKIEALRLNQQGYLLLKGNICKLR